MGKAKIPVSVGGIEFDALIDEELALEASVPEYTVENGYSVSDAIILSPERLSMTLYVTNTPVTWFTRHGSSDTRVNTVCDKIQQLYFSAKPVTITTSDKTYKDMTIESLSIRKSVETGYSREIPIKFKKIYTAKASTTTIPASYGKSGTTAASAGTASTSKASTSSSSTATKKTSSSSSSSSKSSSGSSSKSSILYSAASSAGIL